MYISKKILKLQYGGAVDEDPVENGDDVVQGRLSAQSEAGLLAAAGAVTDLASSVGSSALGVERDAGDDVADGASKIASQFGPWGALAAGVIQGANFFTKAAGEKVKGFEGNTGSSAFQDFTTEDKQFRGLSMGGVGKAAQAYGNKVEAQKQQFAKASNIVNAQKQQSRAASQSLSNVNAQTQSTLAGGNDYSAILAKKGGRLSTLEDRIAGRQSTTVNEFEWDESIMQTLYDQLVSTPETAMETESDISLLKGGGSVIPSGALHKNKHRIEELVPELSGAITTKGIPVISQEEGGEITQHAEVEKEEIIIEITLSKKLEKLWQDGSEDAMIEAGRLLSIEIMENTADHAGITDKLIGNENTDK